MSQKIVILGAGESGTGAALLAKHLGHSVFVSEKGTIKDIYKNELTLAGIDFEEGGHKPDLLTDVNLLIKSPGIPFAATLIVEAQQKNIEVIGEIEFAYRHCTSTIIAITGTDGKTTTTSLVYDILTRAGLDVALGGNIGKSFARQLIDKTFEYYVLEVSSFQLDESPTFHPHIAIITNIAPDHLDRYNYQIDLYIQSKLSIARNMGAEDYLIYNLDNELTINNLHRIEGNPTLYGFSLQQTPEFGAWVSGESFIVKTKKSDHKQLFTMNLSELSLKGKHNAGNSMAASVAADVLEIRKDVIRESLSHFSNIEHRLENLGKVGGVEFINDSKATNVNATWYALESMENPVIWIAGGVDKGNDYSKLKQLVKDKVKMIVCLGVDNRKIHEAFNHDVDLIINTTSMHEAVNVAYKMAAKGDVVVLSPACASFDLFENYEDRGRQFKKSVRNL